MPLLTPDEITESRRLGFTWSEIAILNDGPVDRTYSPAEIQAILDARGNGVSWATISEQTGRGVSSMRYKLGRLAGQEMDQAYADQRSPRAKTRDCRTCRLPFPSPHAGVRQCDSCRRGTVDDNPFEPDGCPDMAVQPYGLALLDRSRDHSK